MAERQEEKKKPLYISTNILERKDIVEGFGKKEIGYLMVALLISIILFFILYAFTGDILIPFIAAIMILTVVAMIVRKDQCNESMIDKLKFMLEFSKSQKKYEYQYMDDLRTKITEVENGK
jgi:c-di-AMP phosphodiesterase-like protein